VLSLLSTPEELAAYNRWVKTHPHGSLWQSLEWKKFQEALGRETRLYAVLERREILASALVVIDRTSFGMSTWDCAKGPLGASGHADRLGEMMNTIVADARKDRCMSLFFSPSELQAIPSARLSMRPSHRCEQAPATRILDLAQPEDAILAQMHQKGRYNIRVAQKHGVRVEESTDVDAFYRLLKETGERDAFGIRPKRHYETFLKALPDSFLLLAYGPAGKETIAGLMGTAWNGTGIYYYGASSYAHRMLMAPYLLQWTAMTRFKAAGCLSYDLLGISSPGASADDPWTGISVFKEKFGGRVVSYPHEQVITLRPVLSALLTLKRRLWK
jgi:lipid II:glycine glycyltransferase (peptidoglycan interpeptide bridge formation enzyme)